MSGYKHWHGGWVDLCLREKKGVGGRYLGEVGIIHLSGQRNSLKVWGLWCRFLLVDCCGWVVNQDGVCIEICWMLALCKKIYKYAKE